MSPSGHGGGGGSSEVAGAVDAVGGEVMVLGSGAGKIGVDITRTANGGEEGGPRDVGGEEMVFRAGAEAE